VIDFDGIALYRLTSIIFKKLGIIMAMNFQLNLLKRLKDLNKKVVEEITND